MVEITENGTLTDIGVLATIQSGWSLSGNQLTNSPTAAETVDLGQAQVALNTGGLRIDQPLDFDQSPGTDVGGDPTLVYNSDTVDVRPIIQAQLASSAGEAVPDSIQVQLTFNGVAQGWTSYETTDHDPGDDYLITAQVDQAVAQSGLYSWSLQVVMQFGGDEPEFNTAISGTARVVVNDSPEPNPDNPFASIDFLGAGWGITGIERLVLNADSNGDILWVNGDGTSAAFTRNSDGSFTSPADDFGTLVENDDNTFTYTAPDQTPGYEFNTISLASTSVGTSPGRRPPVDVRIHGRGPALPGNRLGWRRHGIHLQPRRPCCSSRSPNKGGREWHVRERRRRQPHPDHQPRRRRARFRLRRQRAHDGADLGTAQQRWLGLDRRDLHVHRRWRSGRGV